MRRRSRLFIPTVAVLGLVGIGVTLFSNPARHSKTVAKSKPKAAGGGVIPSEMIETALGSLTDQVSSTDSASSLQQLNELFSAKAAALTGMDAELRKRIGEKGWFTFESIDPVTFGPRDAFYFRDARFLATLAKALIKASDDELTIAKRLFGWISTNIQLADPERMPDAPAFQTCVRGMGSPSARAWVYCELLRQASLDAAVLGNLGEEGAFAAGSVVAVFAKKDGALGVYLFDCGTGMPVAGKAEGSIATLAELAADPALWTSIRGGGKPGKVALLYPGEPESIAPRMAMLQSHLVGAGRFNLHRDFGEWLARAGTAAKSAGGDVGVWPFPGKMRGDLMLPERSAAILESLNLYWLFRRDSPRLRMLGGEFESAAQRFIRFDLEKNSDQLFAEIGSMGTDGAKIGPAVGRTRQDIVYFGGLAQLGRESAQPAVARRWFERYLEQFGADDLSAESILDLGRLCERLQKDGRTGALSPARRLWELLSETDRAAVGQVAANVVDRTYTTKSAEEAAHGAIEQVLRLIDEFGSAPNAATAPENAKILEQAQSQANARLAEIRAEDAAGIVKRQLDAALQEINSRGANAIRNAKREALERLSQAASERTGKSIQLALGTRSQLISVLNAAVKRPDFITRKDFDDVAKKVPTESQALYAKKTGDLSDAQRIRLHRALLYAEFGGGVLVDPEKQGVWVPGAIRQSALCYWREGNADAAKDVLKRDHPALQAVHRVENAAWQRQLEKRPKQAPF
ncbi:MAG TPA: hypothetical protein VNC50_10010 [Planctomycetia bacterium]|nr:hypothetical protein [Planctomycetia bacterium]